MVEDDFYIIEKVKDEIEARRFLESRNLDWDQSIPNGTGGISFYKGKEKVAIYINMQPNEVIIFKWALR